MRFLHFLQNKPALQALSTNLYYMFLPLPSIVRKNYVTFPFLLSWSLSHPNLPTKTFWFLGSLSEEPKNSGEMAQTAKLLHGVRSQKTGTSEGRQCLGGGIRASFVGPTMLCLDLHLRAGYCSVCESSWAAHSRSVYFYLFVLFIYVYITWIYIHIYTLYLFIKDSYNVLVGSQ